MPQPPIVAHPELQRNCNCRSFFFVVIYRALLATCFAVVPLPFLRSVFSSSQRALSVAVRSVHTVPPKQSGHWCSSSSVDVMDT